jgi:hypothetical protein
VALHPHSAGQASSRRTAPDPVTLSEGLPARLVDESLSGRVRDPSPFRGALRGALWMAELQASNRRVATQALSLAASGAARIHSRGLIDCGSRPLSPPLSPPHFMGRGTIGRDSMPAHPSPRSGEGPGEGIAEARASRHEFASAASQPRNDRRRVARPLGDNTIPHRQPRKPIQN